MLDAGVNVGDEEDVGDKVGGDQSWHQVAASPAGPPSQFFATLPSYLSLLQLSTLWHGMVHAISFRVVDCCYCETQRLTAQKLSSSIFTCCCSLSVPHGNISTL